MSDVREQFVAALDARSRSLRRHLKLTFQECTNPSERCSIIIRSIGPFAIVVNVNVRGEMVLSMYRDVSPRIGLCVMDIWAQVLDGAFIVDLLLKTNLLVFQNRGVVVDKDIRDAVRAIWKHKNLKDVAITFTAE